MHCFVFECKPQCALKRYRGMFDTASGIIECRGALAHGTCITKNFIKRRPGIRGCAVGMAQAWIIDIWVDTTLEDVEVERTGGSQHRVGGTSDLHVEEGRDVAEVKYAWIA